MHPKSYSHSVGRSVNQTVRQSVEQRCAQSMTQSITERRCTHPAYSSPRHNSLLLESPQAHTLKMKCLHGLFEQST
jgi:hypothetical protein